MSVDQGGVHALLADFDRSFRDDDAAALARLFAVDGRLMWPEMEDFVGRDAIRAAFTSFVEAFHTISWETDYQVFDVHGDDAYLLGRFIEIRELRDSHEVERVPGRLVLVCRRSEADSWQITHAMTSRFGETTTVPA